jgi:multiple sugar transport system ATP-binding protein
MAAIRFVELVKHYGDTTVIPNLNLEIADEEFVVFVGPSGCGKSTLLRVVAGLETVDGGELYIGNELVNEIPAAKRDIAMVFQDYALYPHMSVYQNMGFALQVQRFDKHEIDRRIRQAARTLDIESLLQRKPKALSGGQRQRVAMGRAMVREPKAFLFDEPLSNLDAKLRVSVRTEIKALAQTLRTTMLFVTHDQVEAMTLADRVVVFNQGQIQQVGTPEQIYEKPMNLFVAGFIGSPAMNLFNAERSDSRFYFNDGNVIPVNAQCIDSIRMLAGDKAIIGVRPEHIIVERENEIAEQDSEISLPVEVDVVEPLGSDTLCFFSVDGQRRVARINPEFRIRPGEKIRIRFRSERVHLFETDGHGRSLDTAGMNENDE